MTVSSGTPYLPANAAPPHQRVGDPYRQHPSTSQPLAPTTASGTSRQHDTTRTRPSQPPEEEGAHVPYPYNMPIPPIQSPRTTRLNMLAAEVPDDLRKDLLWERKTNRIAPVFNNLTRMAGEVMKAPSGNRSTEGEDDEEGVGERMEREREARERYEKMRTKTWNGVIYQRPMW